MSLEQDIKQIQNDLKSLKEANTKKEKRDRISDRIQLVGFLLIFFFGITTFSELKKTFKSKL